jgi:hypothetical protein
LAGDERVWVSKQAISLVEAAVWFPDPPADHGAHRRIVAESLGVVEVLVPGQAAVDRLTQQGGRGVLSVLAGSMVLQLTGRGAGPFGSL